MNREWRGASICPSLRRFTSGMKSAFDSLLVIVFPSVPLSRVKERAGEGEGGSKLTTEVEMRCNSASRSGVSFKHLQRRRVVDPERRISDVVAFSFI